MRVSRIRLAGKPGSLFGAGAILAFAAACGGGGATGSPTGAAGTPTGAAGSPTAAAGSPTGAAGACTGSGGTAVEVVDFAYDPGGVTVAVGDTVTWTNSDDAAHTVSFTGGPDCGRINAGESVSRTFSTTGFFGYLCSIHPTMAGSVTVE